MVPHKFLHKQGEEEHLNGGVRNANGRGMLNDDGRMIMKGKKRPFLTCNLPSSKDVTSCTCTHISQKVGFEGFVTKREQERL